MSEIDEDVVRSMFSSRAHANVAANVPRVERAYKRLTVGMNLTEEQDRKLKLFMYATVRVETGNFSTQPEGVSSFNSYTFPKLTPKYDRRGHLASLRATDEIYKTDYKYSLLNRPFQRYEEGNQKKNLGNSFGDGERFKGRGFIQLTGRLRYTEYAQYVPGLAHQPELANDPDHAATLLVAYVLKNRARILKALDADDMKEARIVVNGRPHHKANPHGLKVFTNAYRAGEKESKTRAEKSKVKSLPSSPAPSKPPPAPNIPLRRA